MISDIGHAEQVIQAYLDDLDGSWIITLVEPETRMGDMAPGFMFAACRQGSYGEDGGPYYGFLSPSGDITFSA